jgi:hypothetical protein
MRSHGIASVVATVFVATACSGSDASLAGLTGGGLDANGDAWGVDSAVADSGGGRGETGSDDGPSGDAAAGDDGSVEDGGDAGGADGGAGADTGTGAVDAADGATSDDGATADAATGDGASTGAPFPCGPAMHCDPATQYCSVLQVGPISLDGGGGVRVCVTFPLGCDAADRCACLRHTLMCTCVDQSGDVTQTCVGP